MESILTSIKKLLGIAEEYEHFDADIIMHINSVFTILTQLGVGPSNGFSIKDKTVTWDEFVEGEEYESIKTYMYAKVKLAFDPPLSSTLIDVLNRMISEYEWRLNLTAEQSAQPE